MQEYTYYVPILYIATYRKNRAIKHNKYELEYMKTRFLKKYPSLHKKSENGIHYLQNEISILPELIFFALKNDKITTAMPLQSPPQWTRKLKKSTAKIPFHFG